MYNADNLTFQSQGNRQRPSGSGLTVPAELLQHLEYQRLLHQPADLAHLHLQGILAFHDPRGRSTQWPYLSWPFPSYPDPSRCTRLVHHRGSSERLGGLVPSSATDASLCGTSSSANTALGQQSPEERPAGTNRTCRTASHP